MKFPKFKFKRSKLKTIIRDNKKLKNSIAYKELMKMDMKLKKMFLKEAEKCKYFSSNGCKHRNSLIKRCNIDDCPI